MSNWNDTIIDEFRANEGHVTTGGFGSSLVLLHSIGAKTGAPRVTPVMSIPQSDGSWLIAASKGGAPDNPAWYANLVAHPHVSIETGTNTVEVSAEVLTGSEHNVGWAQFTARSSGFADYQIKAGSRLIPVIRLSPR
jgi:deazaflavin-dependent oxidoreductase (nitroreductase family)